MTRIDEWPGGELQVFAPGEEGPARRVPGRDGTYEPYGGGFAISLERPVGIFLHGIFEGDDDIGLRHLVLDYDLRDDGSFVCVAIRTGPAGPDLTSGLLRKIGPQISERGRDLFRRLIVRLIELEDGTIAGELPSTRWALSGADPVTLEEDTADASALYDERRAKPGRRPLTDAHLQKVAALYREAGRLEVPRIEYVAGAFPHTSSETIRNWIRHARDRGFLRKAPGRQGGEQPPKGDDHG